MYVSFGLHIYSSNNLQNEINFVGSLSYFLVLTYVSFAIFIPYPHNPWGGGGGGVECFWSTYSLLNIKTLFVYYSFSQLLATHLMKHLLILMCCKEREVLQEQKKVGRVIYVINTLAFFMPDISLQPIFLFSCIYFTPCCVLVSHYHSSSLVAETARCHHP